MYDAVTRNTYAQLFKVASANLPKPVCESLVKVASSEAPLAAALTALLSKKSGGAK